MVPAIADRPTIDKVYVLADKVNDSQRERRENSKIEVLRLWKPDTPLSILDLFWQVLRLKPSIIHFNVHFQSFGKTRVANFVGFSLVLLFRMLGLKTVVLLHNLGEKVDLKKVRLKPSFTNKAGILVATKLLLSASSVVVTVESYVQYLKKRYGHKRLRYIPHGTSAPRPLSTNHEGKVLLMFGHMGPSKGLPTLFSAFEGVVEQGGNIRLIVAGDSHPNFPTYLSDMKKIAPKGVDFVGYVQEETIPEIFSKADVVVLPYSAATGTSGVFHIACTFGKPIVATSLPEIQELVGKGAYALLVPPGDYEALKEAILRILSSELLVAEMSERNLIFAAREQWPAVAEAYEKEYLRLLNYPSSDDGKLRLSAIVSSCETSISGNKSLSE